MSNKIITNFFNLNVFVVYIIMSTIMFSLSLLVFHDFTTFNVLGELIFALTISSIGALSFWANKRTHSFDKLYNEFMYNLELANTDTDLEILQNDYNFLEKAYNEEEYQTQLLNRAKTAFNNRCIEIQN